MDTPPAEVSIDATLVARLVAAQHPALAADVSWLSSGWDNVLFRLGTDYVVRMPRRAVAVPLLENELAWLPVVQEFVDVPIPVPVAAGLPSADFAWPWSIARWAEGVPVAALPVGARDRLVDPLADFLVQLHVPAPPDAPINPVRGTPLAARDTVMRQRLDSGAIPHSLELLAVWERASAAPAHDGPPLWMHGDLHPLNVLAAPSGTMASVLDFGDLGGADPACDLAAAWLFFDGPQRARFRARVGDDAPHDPAAWVRASGWAVSHATAFLMNSADAPLLNAIGHHAVEQLLANPRP